jgi:Protein of unknown function (DUF4058)
MDRSKRGEYAMTLSQAYIQHLQTGPFPDRIDPWSEDDHYFQQIHGSMIDNLIDQIRPQILPLGYRIAKEASLQIAEGRELSDPGVVIEAEIDLQAIHIKQVESGKLVTVVEVISPGNKTKSALAQDYRMRRERLVLDLGVNVVEIDLTRSVKRLFNQPTSFPYHVIIFLPGESPRHIEMPLDKALSRIALPLHGTATAIELQQAYTEAYQDIVIAQQLDDDGFYTADHLPFPSLLTDAQQSEALAKVSQWQAALKRLRNA